MSSVAKNSAVVRYRLTETEFMVARNLHWRALRQGTTLSNLATGGIVALAGLLVLFYWGWYGWLFVGAGGFLVLMTALRSYTWRRAFRGAKKYTDNILLEVSTDGLHVECADGTSDLKWSFFSWYLDTPDYVMLYITKHRFSVIPKKAFADDGRLAQFMELVENNLEPLGRGKVENR